MKPSWLNILVSKCEIGECIYDCLNWPDVRGISYSGSRAMRFPYSWSRCQSLRAISCIFRFFFFCFFLFIVLVGPLPVFPDPFWKIFFPFLPLQAFGLLLSTRISSIFFHTFPGWTTLQSFFWVVEKHFSSCIVRQFPFLFLVLLFLSICSVAAIPASATMFMARIWA